MKKKMLSLMLAALLAFCAEASALDFGEEYAVKDIAAGKTKSAPVFYEIFTGSFSDSDRDGTGDLRGIIDRLDYLNDGDPESGKSLGVRGIWLTPIFPSPSYHKYDVADYYSVDPAFGTMEDLEELIEACHSRGMLIILDLPINHTSVLNNWFIQFKSAHITHNAGNRYYNLYTWLPADSALPAGRHFARLEGTGEYYECNFADNMPELNYDDPAVFDMMLDAAKFWLDKGVDGFRFDAAKYIFFGDNPKSASFWEHFMAELRKVKSDIYTVAEVWDGDGVTEKYTSAFNCFDFTVSQANGLIASTAKQGNVNKLTAYTEAYIRENRELNPASFPVYFIANHDTDRAAGYLTAASGNAQIAANLYLLSPGTPFIYYGEETGLRGSRGGANTDANRRLHMRWGDGDTVRDPVGADYDEKKQTPYTVREMLSDGKSLYNYYKRVLRIRSAFPEISLGNYSALTLEGTKAGGFTSDLDGSRVTVIHNTTLNTVTVDLKAVEGACSSTLECCAGMGGAVLDDGILTLDSKTSAIIR